MLKLSIVIPVYNVEPYIERCIMSCVNQDLPSTDYEIVVVNDGSKDNSLSIIERVSLKYNHIKVVTQTNGGLSAARNTGLSQALGKYIWFVDADDWIKENCLKKVIEICENRNLDLLQICAANMIENNAVRRFGYKDESNVFSGIDALQGDIQYCAPFAIYRREFLVQNNLIFYPGIYHEDNEFSPRVYYFAKRVSSYNDLLYYVFQNPNSITRTINPKKAFDGIIVMNNLHDFMKDICENAKGAFHDIITGTFNGALHDTLYVSKEDVKRFDDELYRNKHLYIHLTKSQSLIYKIEGMLLYAFPHHASSIYKLMNLLDIRKIKRNN